MSNFFSSKIIKLNELENFCSQYSEIIFNIGTLLNYGSDIFDDFFIKKYFNNQNEIEMIIRLKKLKEILSFIISIGVLTQDYYQDFNENFDAKDSIFYQILEKKIEDISIKYLNIFLKKFEVYIKNKPSKDYINQIIFFNKKIYEKIQYEIEKIKNEIKIPNNNNNTKKDKLLILIDPRFFENEKDSNISEKIPFKNDNFSKILFQYLSNNNNNYEIIYLPYIPLDIRAMKSMNDDNENDENKIYNKFIVKFNYITDFNTRIILSNFLSKDALIIYKNILKSGKVKEIYNTMFFMGAPYYFETPHWLEEILNQYDIDYYYHDIKINFYKEKNIKSFLFLQLIRSGYSFYCDYIEKNKF